MDAGSTAAFFVQACGLPKPKFRWLFNGQVLTNGGGISGASTSGVLTATLVIDQALPAHAGDYSVELDNGLEQVASAVANLTVSTIPSKPTILCLHGPLPYGEITPNQTAVFEALVRGYPPPVFQWARVLRSNGVEVVLEEFPGATNRTFVRDHVDFSGAGTYRLAASNALGSATNSTGLIVKRKPLLYVTEAMQVASPQSGVLGSWWELTNLDTNAVNLRGYRWDDWPGNIGGGPTIAQQVIRRPGQCPEILGHDVILQPAESVVLVEGLTPEQFANWWGASNLPPRLQIIRYDANGLSWDGDEISLWNATATEDKDRICGVAFSTAVSGVSKWFVPTNQCFYSLHCPAATFPKGHTLDFDAFFSIPMNSKLIQPPNLTNPFTAIERPVDTVMFLDARVDPSERKVHPFQTDIRLGQPAAYASRFAPRHNRGGNLTFCDGHAQWYRGEQVVETREPKRNGFAIWPEGEILWSADPAADPNRSLSE